MMPLVGFVVAVGSLIGLVLPAVGSGVGRPAPRGAIAGGRSACRATQLSGSLVLAGGAGGNYSYTGMLRNTSSRSCTLDGYPRLVPLDPRGRPARAIDPAGRETPLTSAPLRPGGVTYLLFHPPRRRTVRLSPRQRAFYNLTYGDMPTGRQTTCPSFRVVAVTPPGARAHLTVGVGPGVRVLLSVCGTISVEALEPRPYHG